MNPADEHMTPTPAKISVCADEDFACVKIAGRANFNCGPNFKTLLDELGRSGRKRFVLDLSDCVLMDSTCLGLLAGFGMTIRRDAAQTGRSVELLNPNARVSDLLQNLGVVSLFKVAASALETPSDLETCPSESPSPTREEITRTCLEAHRTLMAVDPDNVPRFKDVAEFLAEDLKRLKQNP